MKYFIKTLLSSAEVKESEAAQLCPTLQPHGL